MLVHYEGKKIEIQVRTLSSLGKYLGLMFRSRKCDNLLFNFKQPGRYAIHSYFVFGDFLALWLDNENNVVEIKRVHPFTTVIRPSVPFIKLVEIPYNDANLEIIKFFVGKRKGLNI